MSNAWLWYPFYRNVTCNMAWYSLKSHVRMAQQVTQIDGNDLWFDNGTWIKHLIHATLSTFSPLHAKFFRGNINIILYLHYVIPPHCHETGSWNPSSSNPRIYLFYIVNISWLLMTWRRKEPGHQQPWYLLCWTGLIWFLHIKGWNLGQPFWAWFY